MATGPITQDSQGSKPTASSLPIAVLRLLGIVLLCYVIALAAYGYYHYDGTRSRLLTYGITDATASFAATAVLLIALAIPAASIFRIIFGRGKPLDFAFALVLPLITWLTSLIPANFDARTGQVLRFCADRPDGSLFCLDHPGIDPITRKKLNPIDPRTAEQEYRRERGLAPRPITADPNTLPFFDPLSGAPKVWFGRQESGCHELFDNAGVHPRTGEQLAPATRELVRQVLACKRQDADRREQERATETRRRDEEHARQRREEEVRAAERAAAERAQREAAAQEAERVRRAQEEAQRVAERTIQPNMSLSQNGFTFVLSRIRRSGGDLLVELLVTADQDNLALSVTTYAGQYSGVPSNTNLYDKAGNLYTPTRRAVVGDREQTDYPVKLDRGIPTRFTVIFGQFPQSAEVKSFVLTYWATWPTGPKSSNGAYFKAPFHDIQ